MRNLTKNDLKHATIVTLKAVAVLVVAFGAIIFTPLLRRYGYQDPSRARAIALALEAIVIMAIAVLAIELLKRWVEWKSDA